MTNTALLLQLVITALTHATEIQQLIAVAQAEGRDVSDAEVASVRARAVAAVDALDAASKPLP